MDKNDIIDYVMHTPHNTNKAVLSSMLNQLTEGGGGGTSWTTLTEESVTTTIVEDSLFAGSDDLIYSERITADIIKVTFNGTEYTCNKRIDNGDSFYGAEWSYATDSYDFSQYPFEITSLSDANFLYTETAGTYQVKIEVPQSSGSSDFSTAQVTIVNGANEIALSGGVEKMSEGYIFIKSTEYGDIGVTALGVPSQSTATAKALLFKNLDLEEIPHEFAAFFNVVDGTIATVDGNCEIVEETSILIWGDCTITIGEAASPSA